MTRVWTMEKGIYYRTIAIPIDGKKIEALIGYICKGLMFHHWDVALDYNFNVDVLSLAPAGESCFSKLMSWNCCKICSGNIGNGALIYEGHQGIGNQTISVWEVSLLGGAIMSEGGKLNASKFGVMTGSKELSERAAIRIKQNLIF